MIGLKGRLLRLSSSRKERIWCVCRRPKFKMCPVGLFTDLEWEDA